MSIDPASLPAAIARISRPIAAISRAMALAAGAAMLALALFMVFDVLNRRLGGIYSGATDEIASYVFAFSASWAMAYTLAIGQHVAIDVLASRMSASVRHAVNLAGLLLIQCLFILIAWHSTLLALDSLDFDARSVSTLRVPLWIPQIVMAAGFWWCTVQGAALLAAALSGGDEPLADATNPEINAI